MSTVSISFANKQHLGQASLASCFRPLSNSFLLYCWKQVNFTFSRSTCHVPLNPPQHTLHVQL